MSIYPPVKIDDLIAEWTKDCQINQLNPDIETLNIAKLHSKYLGILAHHKIVSKKFMHDYSKLKKIKYEYYAGDLNNPDDLKKYGWEPFRKKVLRADMASYIDADEDLNNILIKKSIHDEIVSLCELILKELHSRTFQLKAFMDWHRYNAGN